MKTTTYKECVVALAYQHQPINYKYSDYEADKDLGFI